MKKILLIITLIFLIFSFAQAQTLLGTFNLGSKIATFEEPIGFNVELIWRGKIDDYRAIVEIITPESNPSIKPGYNTIYRNGNKVRFIIGYGAKTFQLNPIGENGVMVWVE